MTAWPRLGAAALGAVLGVLLISPVGAAPPASHDETLYVELDRQGVIEPGGTMTFVMAASYYPSTVAQHRTVLLELPEGVTFRSADNDYAAGPCVPDATGRVVTCTTQDPVDERPALNATWFVTADLADDLPPGEYVTVKTTINTEIPDPDLSNNVGTWKFFVPGPGDMSVAISAPPGPWAVGAEFDAKFTVRNDSRYRSPAQLYSRFSPSSVSHSGWPTACKPIRGTMSCDFAMIEAGATVEFTVHFKVPKYDAAGLEILSTILPVAPDTDRGNNDAAYRADLKPSGSPAPTPTGDTGGNAGGEPSLPITGPSTVTLALIGLSLLVAGAGARFLLRRPA
ncbi:hypothetical protein [Actinoplanes sp. NPDC049118]|uniref:hypothetical protein n=1 Tax=Actinoplanes sp. NPDC049118 TaxID=3155769 RepID=UPI00340F2B41